MPRLAVPLAVLLLAGLAGCGSDDTTDTTAESSTPTSSVSTATASPSPSPSQVIWDAATVLERLTEADSDITNGAVQDETTDPNELMGRPGGYLSRASFDLPGGDTEADPYKIDRGGVIEVWADEESATARAEYIDTVTKGMSPLEEYHYQHGPVLVRIPNSVEPSVATKVEDALAALLD